MSDFTEKIKDELFNAASNMVRSDDIRLFELANISVYELKSLNDNVKFRIEADFEFKKDVLVNGND